MVSHDVTMRRSLPRSISTSLIVLYSTGAYVVTIQSLNQIRASFQIITMHDDAICKFMCTLWYYVSRYILLIKINVIVHMSCMADVMFSIRSTNNM